MIKIPVIIRPDYIFYIEQFEGVQFMHCDVFKWNKTVLNELKKDWFTFTELHGGPLFCVKEQDSPAYLKFIKKLGFKPYVKVQGNTGNEVQVHYWSD